MPERGAPGPEPERRPEDPAGTEGGPGSVRAPGAAAPSKPKDNLGASPSAQPAPETLARPLFQEPVPGKVRILFLDADGTLTDGLIVYDSDGADSRNFWVRDGLSLRWARDLEVLPVVISGRKSKAMAARMEDLGLEYHEGIRDKVAVAEQVVKREGADWNECVMVGDDLPDVALMKRVGWPIAVANAQPEVKLIAKTVLGTYGGHGAVREMVEMVLRHNGTWEKVLEWYEAR